MIVINHNAKKYIPQPYVVINETTEQEYLDHIFSLGVGGVFQFVEQSVKYETIQQRLKEYVPEGKVFEVRYATPGTILYSLYGANTLVVTKNSNGV
jgi:hypothetical protein